MIGRPDGTAAGRSSVRIEQTLIAAIAFIQGYFFLAIVIGIARPLSLELLKHSRLASHRLPASSFVSFVFAVFFLLIAFFGLASYWIDLLSDAMQADRRQLVRIWFGAWFIGILASMIIPLIEASVRRKAGARSRTS